jgi:DNA mismatch repair protein MutH
MLAPASLDELLARAGALQGTSVSELAARVGFSIAGEAVRTKGKVGELLERALGATGGSSAELDFPDLGVELKSVPVGDDGRPLESTFVCAFGLMDAERETFETSWVRRKLGRVLWVPVHEEREGGERRIRRALLWSPTAEQERALKDDFDEIVGRIAIGDIEGLSAHVGKYMQLRPKAADGSVRTAAPGRDGDLVATVPRGFYLRARFVGALLADPTALP